MHACLNPHTLPPTLSLSLSLHCHLPSTIYLLPSTLETLPLPRPYPRPSTCTLDLYVCTAQRCSRGGASGSGATRNVALEQSVGAYMHASIHTHYSAAVSRWICKSSGSDQHVVPYFGDADRGARKALQDLREYLFELACMPQSTHTLQRCREWSLLRPHADVCICRGIAYMPQSTRSTSTSTSTLYLYLHLCL